MSNEACCDDWNANIKKLNAPIELQAIRSGFKWQYDGKPFQFCPWCGAPYRAERGEQFR